MWVCYANYNNIETTLKLEATPGPLSGPASGRPRVEIDRKDKDGGPRCTGLPGAGWTACPTC